MNNYYLTFQLKYKDEKHPILGWISSDGYYLVKANSYSEAREKVTKELGSDWAFLYDEKHFEPEWFPLGKMGIIE